MFYELSVNSQLLVVIMGLFTGALEGVLSLFFFFKWLHRASLEAQLVKNSLAMQEALVQLLGREDPLGKG